MPEFGSKPCRAWVLFDCFFRSLKDGVVLWENDLWCSENKVGGETGLSQSCPKIHEYEYFIAQSFGTKWYRFKFKAQFLRAASS